MSRMLNKRCCESSYRGSDRFIHERRKPRRAATGCAQARPERGDHIGARPHIGRFDAGPSLFHRFRSAGRSQHAFAWLGPGRQATSPRRCAGRGLSLRATTGIFRPPEWLLAERDMDNFELKIQSGGETVSVAKDRVSLPPSGVLDLTNAPVFKLDYKQMAASNSIPPELIAGRVILTEIPDFRREEGPRRTELFQAQSQFLNRMQELKAAARSLAR